MSFSHVTTRGPCEPLVLKSKVGAEPVTSLTGPGRADPLLASLCTVTDDLLHGRDCLAPHRIEEMSLPPLVKSGPTSYLNQSDPVTWTDKLSYSGTHIQSALSWHTSTSTPRMTCWSHEEAGPTKPQLQDLHDSGQPQDV